MNNHQRVIQFDVQADPEEVMRMMGCGRGASVRAEVWDVVRRLVAETSDLIRPKGVYVVREVERVTETQLDLRGCRSVRGPIAQFLRPARRVAVFVVTIGDEIERLATSRMQAGKTLEGYALDAIGSAAAESATDALADHVLWNEAGPDEAVTPPLSPGDCGLPLDEQVPLFAIVNAGAVGVRLSPDMIMQPIKTVSGFLGIGHRDEVTEHGIPCQWCNLPDCRMRRLRRPGQ